MADSCCFIFLWYVKNDRAELRAKMRHQFTAASENKYHYDHGGVANSSSCDMFAVRRLTCEQSKSFTADNDGAQQVRSQISQFTSGNRNNDDERATIQAKIELLRSQHYQETESCPSCLYVGVATSLGLAAYFAHLAMEKIDERTLSDVARRHQRYNKPVFLTFSLGWLAAGAYRWHLG